MHTFKLINIHAYDLLMYVHIYIHGAYYVCISPYIYMLTHIPVDANILNMDANICIYIHTHPQILFTPQTWPTVSSFHGTLYLIFF